MFLSAKFFWFFFQNMMWTETELMVRENGEMHIACGFSLRWGLILIHFHPLDIFTGWQWWDPVVGGAGYAKGALPLPKGV